MKKIEKEIKTFDDDDNDEYKFIYKIPYEKKRKK